MYNKEKGTRDEGRKSLCVCVIERERERCFEHPKKSCCLTNDSLRIVNMQIKICMYSNCANKTSPLSPPQAKYHSLILSLSLSLSLTHTFTFSFILELLQFSAHLYLILTTRLKPFILWLIGFSCWLKSITHNITCTKTVFPNIRGL